MSISLIRTEALKETIDSKNSRLQIVDTRPLEEYEKGHIPGAVQLPWEEWCARPPAGLSKELEQPGYWGRLFDADDERISKRLSELGFANDATIVVYADGARSKGREGRIAWMLLYFGAADVRLLDGGIKAWTERSGALEQSNAVLKSADRTFTLSKDENRRIMLDALKTLLSTEPAPILIDTRTPEEYVGDSYPYMPRTGSIPGSYLLPYVSIFDTKGSFISKENFSRLLPPGKNTKKIAFCEVGVRACTVALLHEIYTGEVMQVYDGSMMEWGADPSLPVSRKTCN